ncbi:MAG: SDR family oxidoreductase [Gammaproteobacteria bacterium]|nr:SDR family oxidoreductase [Gammaproteobacteria bacterium]
MSNPMSLQGRTIVITGAGQGIGLATAQQAYELDANLVLVDINPDTLNEVARQFDRDRVLVCAGNITDSAAVEALFQRAVERFETLNGLVNCAGIIRPAMIHKMTDDQWQQVIDVNLSGSYYCVQAFGKAALAHIEMGNSAPRSIVNVSSIAGRAGTIGQINYSAAKAGLFGISMSAAREWAKYDIRSNSVCFGLVETPMTETVRGEKFRDMALSKIPMNRWSTVEEASQPICFLLSGASSFITGQTINIDGGAYMSS